MFDDETSTVHVNAIRVDDEVYMLFIEARQCVAKSRALSIFTAFVAFSSRFNKESQSVLPTMHTFFHVDCILILQLCLFDSGTVVSAW